MTMILNSTISAAKAETKHYTGTNEFPMAAGKSLKIETSPGGEEVFNEEVPVGKSWIVTIDISIKEVVA